MAVTCTARVASAFTSLSRSPHTPKERRRTCHRRKRNSDSFIHSFASNGKPIPKQTDLRAMALEWVVLGYAAAAEAIMVLLLTIPGLDGLRKGLIAVTRNLLKPFLSVVPFCLFLLMDIYWKYETRPSCEGDSCTPTEHLRHQKSIMKSQRNALLIAAALLFYWLLYSVTNLVVRIEQLNQRVDRLKNRD